jgi:poly(3-hydroxyalkanoate) synthetase
MFDPAEIRAPVMVVAGTRDSVVPPSSALALADAIGSTHVLSPATGHLGIVLGEQADRTVWHPVRDFLMENHAVNR